MCLATKRSWYSSRMKKAYSDWRYLLNGSFNLLHVWFYGGVFWIGTIRVSMKSKMTPMEDTFTTRFLITWKNSSPMNAVYWNTHFLSHEQWYIVLTDSFWTPFDPCFETWSTKHDLPQTTRLSCLTSARLCIASVGHRGITLGSLQQQIDSAVATGSKLVDFITFDGFISKRSPISHSMTITDCIDALRCDFACRMTEKDVAEASINVSTR